MRQYNHLRAMRVSPIEGKLRLLQHVAVLQVFSSAVADTRWYAILQYMLDMSPRKEPIYIYIPMLIAFGPSFLVPVLCRFPVPSRFSEQSAVRKTTIFNRLIDPSFLNS